MQNVKKIQILGILVLTILMVGDTLFSAVNCSYTKKWQAESSYVEKNYHV